MGLFLAAIVFALMIEPRLIVDAKREFGRLSPWQKAKATLAFGLLLAFVMAAWSTPRSEHQPMPHRYSNSGSTLELW
jgi:hypothetical protein